MQFQLLTMNDHLRELADLESSILKPLGTTSRENFVKGQAEAVKYSVTRKREYLDTLVRNHNRYFDRLLELDSSERQLIKERVRSKFPTVARSCRP